MPLCPSLLLLIMLCQTPPEISYFILSATLQCISVRQKRYVFYAKNPFTSRNAKIRPEKVEECFGNGIVILNDNGNVAELRELVGKSLDKYHFYHLHESLKFLTPAQYCGTLGVSIPHVTGHVW
jgi:hypothetical protein